MSFDDALQEFGNAKAALGHALAVGDAPDKQPCDIARTAVLAAVQSLIDEAVKAERERLEAVVQAGGRVRAALTCLLNYDEGIVAKDAPIAACTCYACEAARAFDEAIRSAP